MEFPALASLARDVLSIPATGAGVERLFNSARDICHYHRGSLNSTTIQDLMMYVCTTRFEVEEEQLAFIREFFSKQEREVMIKKKNSLIQEDLDPISDNNKDELERVNRIRVSQHALGKRRKSIVSEVENEGSESMQSGDEVDLPISDTQQRSSGRIRKHSRLLDGYEINI
jgi:hypothetical protein